MIMRTMGVKGLTLYHLKSHLQDMGSVTSSSTRMLPQDLNDGFEVTEALRVQMEVQRRLHEQLEVQQRTSRPCPVKSLSYKVGGMLRCCNSTNRYERLDSELERKLMEVKKRYVPGNSSIRSLNSIILRFPQFRQGLE
nr:probable calcium-binding protein CML22 isoform X1 [Tanacetum cinerariifolium]